MKANAIAIRVRRTWTEEVHVIVEVTDAVMHMDAPDGPELDVKAVFAKAVEMGQTESHAWRSEGGPVISLHPIQTPLPRAG
jgi:hypothetical protein